jgi:hypothetical protein
MNTVVKFIKMDWKMVLCKRTLGVMGLIALVVLIFVQSGVYKYETLQLDKKEFQEIERLKVESYKRVEEFGIIGLKLIFIPEPAIIFFSNSAVNFDIISHINSADVLDMDQSSLGKKLFSDRKGGYKDFSGLIILLVSLAVLYLGINSVNHPEFRKFLASLAGHVKLYLLLIFSRTLLIVLYLALITVGSVVLVLLNHVSLPSHFYAHMSGFFLMMVGVILGFYALGTFLGTFKNRVSSILLGIGIWFLLIFLVPEGINYIVEKQAEKLNSNFKYELDKIRHEMGFEERGKKKLDKYSTPKTRKKMTLELVDSYLLNEAISIEKLEQERGNAMRDLLETRKMLSIFFPSSFYLETAHSVSSGGYEAAIDFYRRTYQLKHRFVRWYFKQRYGTEGGKPPHFIKGDENIFYSNSCMCQYFTPGLALTYFYALLLCWAACLRLRNNMYSMNSQDTAVVSGKDIKLETNRFSPWQTRGNQLGNFLFLLFSGQIKKLRQSGYTGGVIMDNVDISKVKYRGGFIYICRPRDVPGDINIGDWVALTAALMKFPAGKTREFMERPDIHPHLDKQFEELSRLQQSEILLALVEMGKFDVYLVNDTAAGLSRDFFLRLNDRLEAIAQTGPAVIYLSSVYIPIKEEKDKKRENPFFPDKSWPHDIALMKRSRSNIIKSGKPG